jgi:uncharacterized membrane protein YdbT with pleckstrin-like domain
LGYVESTLAPGEEIRHRARYHWWHYRAALVFLLLAAVPLGVSMMLVGRTPDGRSSAAAIGRFGLVLAAISGFLFVLRYVQASAVEMVVTSRRAVAKRGIFRSVVAQVDLSAARPARLTQGTLGRFFGFGSVSVEAAGAGGTVAFRDIGNPEAALEAIRGSSPAVAEATR